MLIKVYVDNLKPVVLKSSSNLFFKPKIFSSLRKTIEYIVEFESAKKIKIIILDKSKDYSKIKNKIQSIYFIDTLNKEVNIKHFNEKLVTKILNEKGFVIQKILID